MRPFAGRIGRCRLGITAFAALAKPVIEAIRGIALLVDVLQSELKFVMLPDTEHDIGRPTDGADRTFQSDINSVFECFTRLEAWYFGRFDLDRSAGLRVATSASCALLDGKSAKTYKNHRLILLQRLSNSVDQRIDGTGGGGFW